jgi:cobalt-zinc-cadmium efflux system outer membrane protein
MLLNIPLGTEIAILPSTITVKNPDEISLPDLLEMAKTSRPEFLLADLEVKYSEKLLRFEKSQRAPDISLSFNYDRYGGEWKNFIGIGIGIDIPVFDRNQGGVRMARLGIEQANYKAEYEKNMIQQEIIEFYNNYKISYDFYRRLADDNFFEDLENMLEVYSRNLLNRNISMLEYIDFMDSYRATKRAILTARKNLDTSFSELQYSVNNQIK